MSTNDFIHFKKKMMLALTFVPNFVGIGGVHTIRVDLLICRVYIKFQDTIILVKVLFPNIYAYFLRWMHINEWELSSCPYL